MEQDRQVSVDYERSVYRFSMNDIKQAVIGFYGITAEKYIHFEVMLNESGAIIAVLETEGRLDGV